MEDVLRNKRNINPVCGAVNKHDHHYRRHWKPHNSKQNSHWDVSTQDRNTETKRITKSYQSKKSKIWYIKRYKKKSATILLETIGNRRKKN